ncbi:MULTISPECIES: hypothetical protein [unclassified Clostridium]|uniref:hypothetical protein n=1 Tax=unclassified Clostridium TaxID=2614128 RepID=UPI00189B0B0D|nr:MULTISPECIES: hypothetical protein [unclassified Clostridium]MCR1950199.1 hypothetical protein [Clostridium sp. DSM 100503]
MNFLLNKIDTDLRKKVYEKTKDGKVHRKSNISINKDSEKQKKKFFNEYVKKERKQMEQNKFTVDATKLEKSTISLHGEKEENLNAIGYGTFLDVKK